VRARGRWLSVLAMLVAGASVSSGTRAAADILLGGAATRGFYDWEVLGGYERALPVRPLARGLTFPVRIEGHFATREGVTNLTLSTYGLAFYTIPGFEKVDFSPYVATGPGLHLQGAWTNLGDFGDVLVEDEASLKWHILVGSRLVAGKRADLYTEARYTAPSDYDFDYIAFGVRIHGPRPDTPAAPEPPDTSDTPPPPSGQ
jgi:hypothetical protein